MTPYLVLICRPAAMLRGSEMVGKQSAEFANARVNLLIIRRAAPVLDALEYSDLPDVHTSLDYLAAAG
jgi:hypothetical protein